MEYLFILFSFYFLLFIKIESGVSFTILREEPATYMDGERVLFLAIGCGAQVICGYQYWVPCTKDVVGNQRV
jgi:hypothetical protein